jgi:hypothetical protein
MQESPQDQKFTVGDAKGEGTIAGGQTWDGVMIMNEYSWLLWNLYHACILVLATRSIYNVCYFLVDWWCELCGDDLLWDAILLCRFGLIYSKLIRTYSPFGIHTPCNGGHWELQLRTSTRRYRRTCVHTPSKRTCWSLRITLKGYNWEVHDPNAPAPKGCVHSGW